MRKKYFVLFFISVFLFSLFIRLFKITSIPSFVVSDEIQYIGEARSLALSGKDLSGTWSPFSLTSSNSWYAELPGVILLPATVLFWDSPMLSAKITHVLMGSLIPLLLAGISYGLFQNRRMAMLTAGIASLNPWFFQFSRLAFESFFSIFFYLLGFCVVLLGRGKYKLFALIPFFLGFFQYQGHKLLLVPFAFLLTLYYLYDRIVGAKPRRSKLSVAEFSIAIVFLCAVLVTGIFALRLPSQEANKRTSHITILNDDFISAKVNEERRLSIESPLQKLFTNKVSVVVDDSLSKFFGSFNPVYLFFGGANSSDSWAVTSKGKFYILDAVLIFIGWIILANKKTRKGMLLLVGMVVVAPFPAMLPEGALWATFRSAFIIPILIIVAGAGMWQVSTVLSKKLFSLFLLAYVLATIPFFYDYFFRYPIYNTKDTYFYERVVASYLHRANYQEKITFLADETRHLFITILFYNGWLTKETYAQISSDVANTRYVYKNFEAKGSCFDPALLVESPVVLVQRGMGYCPDVDEKSDIVRNRLSIASLIDSGEFVQVYGDTFCRDYPLGQYSSITKNIFDVEKLSDEEFCRAFFVKY